MGLVLHGRIWAIHLFRMYANDRLWTDREASRHADRIRPKLVYEFYVK